LQFVLQIDQENGSLLLDSILMHMFLYP
jgi:hypothetical protein